MPAIPPSPAADPQSWDTLMLGANKFPPRYPGVGRVKVTCDGGAEVDRPKVNGKDGAEAKFKGKRVTDLSFEVSFISEVWDEAMAYYIAIDPQAAGYGKIWETVHPACVMRGANKVLIESMTGIVSTGDLHTFTGKGSGWFAPDKPKGAGGTSTPKKAEKWVDTKPDDPTHTYAKLSNGNKVDLGTGPVEQKTTTGNKYGFGGSAAPNEDP